MSNIPSTALESFFSEMNGLEDKSFIAVLEQKQKKSLSYEEITTKIMDSNNKSLSFLRNVRNYLFIKQYLSQHFEIEENEVAYNIFIQKINDNPSLMKSIHVRIEETVSELEHDRIEFDNGEDEIVVSMYMYACRYLCMKDLGLLHSTTPKLPSFNN